ncbi:MAG TPA: 6-phosphogluconolactonase [Solirubrobacteraceae bacterium]
MTRLCTLLDAEAVAQRAAREIAQQVEQARAERGTVHMALSGGTTPERTHEVLASTLEDWSGIEVWFADERCVGPEDAQSNYLMVRKTLLEHIATAPPVVHRMEGERGPEQGAERYASELSAVVAGSAEGVPVLDVVVLGIGPDGHVASLFPGAPTLDAGEEAVCLGVRNSPKPPPQRITLSLAVLRAARRCILPATGAGKRDAVQAALGEATPHVPASLLRRERLMMIVDDAASPPPPHQSADCENL